MKKIALLLLCFVLCISLLACGEKEISDQTGTKGTQSTENTKQTQNGENTSLDERPQIGDIEFDQNNEILDNTNDDDKQEVSPTYVPVKIENNKIIIPETDIEYILISDFHIGSVMSDNVQFWGNEMKYTYPYDISNIVKAIKNINLCELTETPKPSVGGSSLSLEICFDDNTCISMSVQDNKYLSIAKKKYVAENDGQIKELIDAFSWPEPKITYAAKETEFSGGKIAFSEDVERIKITKYYFDQNNFPRGHDALEYDSSQFSESVEEISNLFCSLNLSKVSEAPDIPNTRYNYTSFKFYSLNGFTYTEIKMIYFNSEIFFKINGEFYTVNEEQIDDIKAAISFSI